jgi:hypothetical protein
MRVTLAAPVLLALVAACAASSSAPGDRAVSTDQPLLGNADGSDGADRACNVVLREVHINQNRGGYEESCPGGGSSCWIVVRGTIDVANAAIQQGAIPMLLWQSGSGAWSAAPAPAVAGGVLGYERHEFALEQGTIDPNQPWPALHVIPYLANVGGRLFDHNRLPGPLDSYALDASDQWSVADDESTCPGGWPQGLATASFQTGWTDSLSGTLVQGGKLTINYDLARTPGCESSTYNGLPAWNTEAYLRFDPDGPVRAKSVRGLQDAQGAWHEELFTVDVPADATRAEVWFETSGEYCATTWDSNWGKNWSFDVAP